MTIKVTCHEPDKGVSVAGRDRVITGIFERKSDGKLVGR
jgi:hypothetical protein